MKCKLCKKREADKKNTHFLTDAAIRQAVNQDGRNVRDSGLYFDFSNTKAFVDFNFQQSTSKEKIEEVLKREITKMILRNQLLQMTFLLIIIFVQYVKTTFVKSRTNLFMKYLKN